MVTENKADAVITPPVASPPLTMDPTVLTSPAPGGVVGDQFIARPGRWRVGEYGFGDGVVLLFAGQSGRDARKQNPQS